MPVVGLKMLLDEARRDGYGVLAANVILLDHAESFASAAEEVAAPIVLQISQNAVRYHGGLAPIATACMALAERAATRIALHLDHATSLDLCREAADLGFGSVMFDASAVGDDENITRTAEATAWAHARGLFLEAEIGIVGGKDGNHTASAPTEPEEARRFVDQTGADALAVQVGTSHAQTTRRETLDLERIGRLRDAVTVPLVLHGSSGVADAHLTAGIHQGLVKVNVGTRFNVAFTTAVRMYLGTDPAVVDPRRFVGEGRSAMRAEAVGLLRMFGAAGRG